MPFTAASINPKRLPQDRKRNTFLIRWSRWEFWPMYITNIPVMFFWVFNSIRALDPSFFSAVNPSLRTGGFYGNSKWEIFQLIPRRYLPVTLHVRQEDKTSGFIEQLMRDNNLGFPIILKPDIGERGMNVHKVEGSEAIGKVLDSIYGDVILQEYVDYPLEISVLCYRFPLSGKAGVTSVCVKEFLSVTGDGIQSIRELMQADARALLQIDRISALRDIEVIPPKGEKVPLEPIGNHSRGTKFIDGVALLDDQLKNLVLSILDQMDGVQYGRFDIRAQSVEDLKRGDNFKIIEFNGVNSEPVHIYDPAFPFSKIYPTLWYHWDLMYRISKEQKRAGVSSMGVPKGLRALRDYVRYKRHATRKSARARQNGTTTIEDRFQGK